MHQADDQCHQPTLKGCYCTYIKSYFFQVYMHESSNVGPSEEEEKERRDRKDRGQEADGNKGNQIYI